jgi:ABC-type bacteriocin/lantibiotic exporter with double-glycine peptidase domain
MTPVIQLERTGCGIASVAAIAGISYSRAKAVAASLGIFADDQELWSETAHVRRLLGHFGLKASPAEMPFRSWEELPNLALLSIKWHLEKGRPFWHWVVFARETGRYYVLDSRKGLRQQTRTDFGRMKPKWFIGVADAQPSLGAASR